MRKLTALFILFAVFFPLAITALSLVSIRPWVLDRGFYERIVSNEQIYDILLTEQLPNPVNREVFGDDERLPFGALNLALREVLTADYLRAQSLSIVDQAFDFIDGRSDSIDITADVAPVKAALAGEGGVRFANVLAANLPACDPGQDAIAPAGRLVRCIESNGSVAAAAAQIALALPTVLEDIPDQIRLNQSANYGNDWFSSRWFGSGYVRFSLDIALFSVIFSAIAVGIVGAYLGGDSLRERLIWLATALFVPASLFVIMGFSISAPFIGSILRSGMRFARWDGVVFTEAFEQALSQMILPIVQQIGTGFLITGLAGCVIAVVLVIWSWSVPSVEKSAGKMVQIPAQKA